MVEQGWPFRAVVEDNWDARRSQFEIGVVRSEDAVCDGAGTLQDVVHETGWESATSLWILPFFMRNGVPNRRKAFQIRGRSAVVRKRLL